MLEVDALIDGLRSGRRRALAKAITLVEGQREDQRKTGYELLRQLPSSDQSIRVGVTGVPGVGKSTFIEELGLQLIGKGHRVAVLAIDPSSSISGGSLMGDKLRMPGLATADSAFIRPSPTAGSLGGVARKTRDTMLLCEAAGYDVILVETVGVGQSEVTVSSMVDFVLMLILPNSGDEIQGIKKGIVELADAMVVHKADGDATEDAGKTRLEYQHALKLVRPRHHGWQVPVLAASSLEKRGLEDVWDQVIAHRTHLEKIHLFKPMRDAQAKAWYSQSLRDELIQQLMERASIIDALKDGDKEQSPFEWAQALLRSL